jgi:hypothetical protein
MYHSSKGIEDFIGKNIAGNKYNHLFRAILVMNVRDHG